MVHKTSAIGKNLDLTKFKFIDLFWVLPYWLHNIPSGRAFCKKFEYLGNLWKFEYVVKHILKEKPNPIQNVDIPRLWQSGQFADIAKHLELDLIHTFSFLKSSVIQETLTHIQKQHFNRSACEDHCPFRQLLQNTSDRAVCYCTLLQEVIPDERTVSTIDVIDSPLPRKGVAWIPSCIK